MSERVIICGARGQNGVDIAQIRQMGGRAGRSKKDANPIVHIVAEEECLPELSALDVVPPVNSAFDEIHAVSFHLLSKIGNESVQTIGQAETWFSRSFAHCQGRNVDFLAIFSRLTDLGAVECRNGAFRLTGLGQICKRYYFAPEVVCSWRDKFNALLKNGDFQNDCALAWALASGRVTFDVGYYGIADELLSQFPAEYRPSSECVPEAVLWLSVFRGVSVPGVAAIKKGLRQDWGRIFNAICALNLVSGFKFPIPEADLHNLDLMVRHGVGYEACQYFDIPGMTSSAARHFAECSVPLEDAAQELAASR